MALLVALACVFLPPYEVPWLAQAVAELRDPIVAAVVALVIIVVAGSLPKAFIASVIVLLLAFGAVQVVQWRQAVSLGEAERNAAASWTAVPLTTTDQGEVANDPNDIGQASVTWNGNTFDIHFTNQVGSTQQGLYWSGGEPSGSFFFTARTPLAVPAPYIGCPLIFGAVDRRDYLMFYIEPLGENRYHAKILQRWPNGNEFGFDGQDFLASDPLPSVGQPDVFSWWHRSAVELSISAEGNDYSFFVNDRLVYEMSLPDRPRTVALGATAVTNDAASQFTCHFTDVSLQVE